MAYRDGATSHLYKNKRNGTFIEVKWPTMQKMERFMDVSANQILAIRMGSGIVAAVKPKTK